MKRGIINLIEVKSSIVLFRMLLVCRRPYLTSVLRYKFSKSNIIIQALHLRKQGHDVRGYF